MKNKIFSMLFVISLFLLFGCEKENSNLKPCEINNTGTIEVRNNTGRDAWISYTYILTGEHNWSYAYPGYKTYYRDINAGKVYIWIMFDGSTRKQYIEITLKPCSYQPVTFN